MKREWRVVWRREPEQLAPGVTAGGARRTAIFQTEDAARRKALRLQGRLCEALGVDPDAPWCCAGDPECGCRGSTWREREEGFRARDTMRQPLVELRIESRPVGAWGNSEDLLAEAGEVAA